MALRGGFFLLAAMVFFSAAWAEANEQVAPERSLKDFMRLVVSSPEPEKFGFSSTEEARRAKLGRDYGVWWIEAWKEHVASNGGVGSSDPNAAVDKIYEVLGDDGSVKCVMSFARDEEGQHQPMTLSIISAGALEQLRGKEDKDKLVIVIDEEGLKWADVRNPLTLHGFADGVGTGAPGPRGGLLE